MQPERGILRKLRMTRVRSADLVARAAVAARRHRLSRHAAQPAELIHDLGGADLDCPRPGHRHPDRYLAGGVVLPGGRARLPGDGSSGRPVRTAASVQSRHAGRAGWQHPGSPGAELCLAPGVAHRAGVRQRHRLARRPGDVPRPIRHAPPTGQGARSSVDRRQRQRRLRASPGRFRRRAPGLARHLLGQRAAHSGRPVHGLALAAARPARQPTAHAWRGAARARRAGHCPVCDCYRGAAGVSALDRTSGGVAVAARCRWGRRAVDPPRVRASDALSGRAFPAAQPPYAGPVRAIRRGQPDLLRSLLRLPALAAAGTAARARPPSAWSCSRSRVRRSC